MRMLKKHIADICIITVCILLFVSCGKNENSIAYGDVVFAPFSNMQIRESATSDDPYTKFLTTYGDAADALTELGVSESAASEYDEAYFTDNDLLIAAFIMTADYKYTVHDLVLDNNILQVCLYETGPEVIRFLDEYQAILVDIPKGSVPEDVGIDVQFKQIIEK